MRLPDEKPSESVERKASAVDNIYEDAPDVPPKNFSDEDAADASVYDYVTDEERRGGNSADSGITLQDIARGGAEGGAAVAEGAAPTYDSPVQVGRHTEQEYYELGDVYAEISQLIPPDFDFSTATVRKVSEILRLLRLHKYIKKFQDEDIDGEMLLEITQLSCEDETKELFQMNAIHFKKLHRFVHKNWRPKA